MVKVLELKLVIAISCTRYLGNVFSNLHYYCRGCNHFGVCDKIRLFRWLYSVVFKIFRWLGNIFSDWWKFFFRWQKQRKSSAEAWSAEREFSEYRSLGDRHHMPLANVATLIREVTLQKYYYGYNGPTPADHPFCREIVLIGGQRLLFILTSWELMMGYYHHFPHMELWTIADGYCSLELNYMSIFKSMRLNLLISFCLLKLLGDCWKLL